MTDDAVYNTESEIANELNKYFAEIGAKLAEVMINNNNWTQEITLKKTQQHSFYLEECNNEEVERIITGLKCNKAPGPDKITASTIKRLSDILIPVLTYLINNVFSEGKYPEELKSTIIIPIHKEGDKNKPENFRPIALTSVFSKIMEKIIKQRIMSYLKKIQFISSKQYAFQENTNTQTAVLDLITEVENEIENGKYTVIIFLDLKKAFDTISKDILISKMEKIGIRGKQLELIRSYLRNRPQVTKVGETSSSVSYAKYGVPQGSVLGPLLYLIYINDIEKIKKNGNIYLFADDTCLFYSGKSMREIQDNITEDMVTLEEWFKKNLLTINAKKTKYMIVTNKNKRITEIDIKINNTTIERTDCYKYLGLWIDKQLTWNTHTDRIRKKLNPLVGALRKVAEYLPTSTLQSIYHSLIISKISYLLGIWGNTSKGNLQRMQTMQNKAIKAIYKMPYRTSTRKIHENQMLVSTRVEYEQLVTIKEILNGRGKVDINLTRNEQIHNHQTRNKSKIHLGTQRTNMGKKRITYVGTKLYNRLPIGIKNIRATKKFKTEIKKFLIANQFERE